MEEARSLATGSTTQPNERRSKAGRGLRVLRDVGFFDQRMVEMSILIAGIKVVKWSALTPDVSRDRCS